MGTSKNSKIKAYDRRQKRSLLYTSRGMILCIDFYPHCALRRKPV
jgi:hypothetical protein